MGRVVPDASASEVDAPVAGISPPDTQVLAAGAALRSGHEIHAAITYYVAASGAAVFDAGSVFAGCSTTDTCEVIPVPPITSAFWSETILTVVKGFARPRFGAEHPPAAAATASPSYNQLLHRYGQTAVGRAIAGDE